LHCPFERKVRQIQSDHWSKNTGILRGQLS
jgi:hypothetical protein